MPYLTISSNVNDNIFGVSANDIYLDNLGNIALSSSIQAILENCAQAARTRLGEEVLNTNIGIPYFSAVFVGVPNLEQAEAAFRAAWLAVSGVVEVVSIMLSQAENTLSYIAVIRTTEGTGTLNASI